MHTHLHTVLALCGLSALGAGALAADCPPLLTLYACDDDGLGDWLNDNICCVCEDCDGGGIEECVGVSTDISWLLQKWQRWCIDMKYCAYLKDWVSDYWWLSDCEKNEILAGSGCAAAYPCNPFDAPGQGFDIGVWWGDPWFSPLGPGSDIWTLNSWVESRIGFGLGPGFNLSRGSWEPTIVDLSLPSPGFNWTIGRAYSMQLYGVQGGVVTHVDADGYQGFNWLQTSQTQMRLIEADPLSFFDIDKVQVRMENGSVRTFLETEADSDVFLGLDAEGVVVFEAGSGGDPSTYVFVDQDGTQRVYFADDVDVSDTAKAYQLWKIIDPAGNTAWVGHPTNINTALDNGYNSSGRILMAVDPGGRRYTYTYSGSNIGTTPRLIEVKAEHQSGGSWTGTPQNVTTVATVTYDYYDSDVTGKGLTGDLQLVTVSTPTSEDDSMGADITVEHRTYYRYYTAAWDDMTDPHSQPHGVKYVLDQEGTRAFDYAADGDLTTESFAGATDSALAPYARAYFEYDERDLENNKWAQITSTYTDGECGGTYPDGRYDFTYQENDFGDDFDYDTDQWARRTIVSHPDGSYTTHQFDIDGRLVTTIINDSDPLTTTPTKEWVEYVKHDNRGNATEIWSPEAVASYSFSGASAGITTGKTQAAGGGLISVYSYSSDKALRGSPTDELWKDGTDGTEYLIASTEYMFRELDVMGTGATIRRPFVEYEWTYDEQTAGTTPARHDNGTNPSGSRETAHTYYFYEDTTDTDIDFIVPEVIKTTMPAVTTGNNGSGTASSAFMHQLRDGRPDFLKSPQGIIDYTGYDPETGQAAVLARDADTSLSASGQIFNGIPIPSGTGYDFDSTGDELHLLTTMTYDPQGRLDETTLFAHSQTDKRITKSYYTRLADGQQVTLSIPKVSGSTFYGPVGYTVFNHRGRRGVRGILAVDGGQTTAPLADWIDEDEDNPVAAVADADLMLSRVSTTLFNAGGNRELESRIYFNIPVAASWPGSNGVHFDATTFEYQHPARVIRREDPTGTIVRIQYDEKGRMIACWTGTDDAGFPSSGDMTKVVTWSYDGGSDGGNNYLTQETVDADGNWNTTGDQRIIEYEYDVRGRMVFQSNPAAPDYVLNKFDNRDRLTASGLFEYNATNTVDSTDDPTTREDDRLALSQMFYDELGRPYRSQTHKILATGEDDDHLDQEVWYDSEGRVVKIDGEQLLKLAYDRIGRSTHQYVLAADNDSSYGDVLSVSGDVVVEESQAAYDPVTGYLVMSARIDREHDDYGASETLGALDTNADGDPLAFDDADIKGRIQISAMWHDALGRVTTSGFYGTNGGTDFDYASTSEPTGSTASVLAVLTMFDDDGSVLWTKDPKGNKAQYEYDDASRRTAVINNYVNGVPGDGSGDDDQTIQIAYANGLVSTVTADLPSGQTDEVTTYEYGVTTSDSPGASNINANNLLRKVIYPDDNEAGESESDHSVLYAYNALSEQTWSRDQLGAIIQTDYDLAGRSTADRVTYIQAGMGLDQSVLRIQTAYDALGRVDTVGQYSAATGGTLLDEVKFTYDAWGNISTFEQDHDSAIGGTHLYDVDYTYAKATGGRNTLRLASMTMPNGTTVGYQYLDAAGGLGKDGDLSRVSRITIGLTAVAIYDYLGLDGVAKIDCPQPDVFSALYGGSGYDSLDTFNRVIHDTWTKDLATDRDFYDVTATYDYNSNVVNTVDAVHTNPSGGAGYFDAEYTMDALNRLAHAARGDWNGSTLSSKQEDEAWSLDQVGNWDLHQLDLNGDGSYTGDDLEDARTYNEANELVSRDIDDDGTDELDITHDKVGHLTDDGELHQYVYDPFGRLRQVKERSSGDVIAEFRYNGLGYRITAVYDTNSDGSLGDETEDHLVYDTSWRVAARYEGSDSVPTEQWIYHCAGLGGMGHSLQLDAVALRDRDTDGNGSLDERVYCCQNWHGDNVALVTSDGKQLEQVRYTPYGVPFGLPAGDTNADGVANVVDSNQIGSWMGAMAYDVRGDLNLDGTVDGDDLTEFSSGPSGESLGRGMATRTDVLNTVTYAGYRVDPFLGAGDQTTYHVRNRVYFAELGQWSRRDPIGYADGLNMYGYGVGNPVNSIDPLGLDTVVEDPGGGPGSPPITSPTSSVPDSLGYNPEDLVPSEENRPYKDRDIEWIMRDIERYTRALSHPCNASKKLRARKALLIQEVLWRLLLWQLDNDNTHVRVGSMIPVNNPELMDKQILYQELEEFLDALVEAGINLSSIVIGPEEILISLGAKGLVKIGVVSLLKEGAGALAATAVVGTIRAGSARALARSLEAAGFKRLAGEAAHHIVALADKRAAPARAVLDKFGIGIDDAANGVFLPRNLKSPNPLNAAVHSTVHTNAYYRALNGALGNARSREQALQALDSIRQRLSSGGFP